MAAKLTILEGKVRFVEQQVAATAAAHQQQQQQRQQAITLSPVHTVISPVHRAASTSTTATTMTPATAKTTATATPIDSSNNNNRSPVFLARNLTPNHHTPTQHYPTCTPLSELRQSPTLAATPLPSCTSTGKPLAQQSSASTARTAAQTHSATTTDTLTSPLYSHRYIHHSQAQQQQPVQSQQQQQHLEPFPKFPSYNDENGNWCVSILGKAPLHDSPSGDKDVTGAGVSAVGGATSEDSFVQDGTFLTSIPEKLLCLPTFTQPSATVSSNSLSPSLMDNFFSHSSKQHKESWLLLHNGSAKHTNFSHPHQQPHRYPPLCHLSLLRLPSFHHRNNNKTIVICEEVAVEQRGGM